MRKLQERQIKIVTFNIKPVIRWKFYLTQRLLNPTQSWHLWFTKTCGNFTQPVYFQRWLSLKENLTCLIENSSRVFLIIFDVTFKSRPSSTANPTISPVLFLNFNVRCSRSINIRRHASTIILYSADKTLVSSPQSAFEFAILPRFLWNIYPARRANANKLSIELSVSFSLPVAEKRLW